MKLYQQKPQHQSYRIVVQYFQVWWWLAVKIYHLWLSKKGHFQDTYKRLNWVSIVRLRGQLIKAFGSWSEGHWFAARVTQCKRNNFSMQVAENEQIWYSTQGNRPTFSFWTELQGKFTPRYSNFKPLNSHVIKTSNLF